MCKEVRIDRVLEVKAYAYLPWVARPEVMILEDKEQARMVIEDYKPGQVDLYVDASVHKGRAGIGMYTMPSQACISKVVVSSDQADAYVTELIAISEAANWPWGPSCTAFDREGLPVPASSIRIFSDSQSALMSIRSWRAGACQDSGRDY